MLYVCYMFSNHITCFKASGYRGLRSVMLYGYMFLRNSFFKIQHRDTAYGLRSPRLWGAKVRAPWGMTISPKPLGNISYTPMAISLMTYGRYRSTPIADISKLFSLKPFCGYHRRELGSFAYFSLNCYLSLLGLSCHLQSSLHDDVRQRSKLPVHVGTVDGWQLVKPSELN